MHIYYSMYFYYLLYFITHILSLTKLGDMLLHLSLSVISCIAAELGYVGQTVGIWIGKWLLDEASSNDRDSHVGPAKIGWSCNI